MSLCILIVVIQRGTFTHSSCRRDCTAKLPSGVITSHQGECETHQRYKDSCYRLKKKLLTARQHRARSTVGDEVVYCAQHNTVCVSSQMRLKSRWADFCKGPWSDLCSLSRGGGGRGAGGGAAGAGATMYLAAAVCLISELCKYTVWCVDEVMGSNKDCKPLAGIIIQVFRGSNYYSCCTTRGSTRV